MSDKAVVVCDDDEFVYFTVQTYMEKMGYKVYEAHKGEDAIALASEHQPVVMFQDIEMPGMDGLEVCRRIRSNPITKSIPLIFVSARDMSNGYDEVVDAGGDYFVAKPFKPTDLAADLYFLAETRFKPDFSTLSRLRVAHPLAVERAKKRPKTTDVELQTAAVDDSTLSYSEETLVAEFKKLRLLVLSLSKRVQVLENELSKKGVLGKKEMDDKTRAAVWGAQLKENQAILDTMKIQKGVPDDPDAPPEEEA